MIRTQDDHFVLPTDKVYEIRYTWFNAEISLAEAYEVQAGEAETKGIRIWKDLIQCDRECIRINNANKYRLEEPEPTIKTIAHEHLC